MKRIQAVMVALLLPLVAARAGDTPAAPAVEPASRAYTIDVLLDGIQLPVAPLITERSGICAHDALRWLQFQSQQLDAAAGCGVPLEVRVPDPRAPEARVTMDAWYEFEDWRQPPRGTVLSPRVGWCPPLGPRIEQVTARDYLEHVLAAAGWAYRIEAGKVVVFDPNAAAAKDAEPPSGTEGLPRRITNRFGMELILISPGQLTVSDRQTGGSRTLAVDGPFYLGKFEVTQEQWQRVMMGDNPSTHRGSDWPVEMVSWQACAEFCERLSAVNGRGYRYRLPTGAEWEYACRAGSTAAFCFGDDAATLAEYAWYGANSGNGVDGHGNAIDGSSYPVGRKRPNGWGLFDMHGNVNEWVADGYDPPADTRARWAERSGRPVDTPWRTYRGGCYSHDAMACRSDWWTFYPQTDRSPVIGFRVAAEAPAARAGERKAEPPGGQGP